MGWMPIRIAYEEKFPVHIWNPYANTDAVTTAITHELADCVMNVYDCKVEGVNYYYANGIKVHNCSEIILRPNEFCNLSEVIGRSDDTVESLMKKIEAATILGTIQSTLDHFRYLRKEWRENCVEERLLGVSLTGIMDCPILATTDNQVILSAFRQHAVDVNKKYATILGINPSCAITCVKPSGTVSQLVNSSSGIHPRYSHKYIRTVRCDKRDPLYKFMKNYGVLCEDDVRRPKETAVFSFAIESPPNSITRANVSAIQQLMLWKNYAVNYCEHKPSITVYVRDHEWLEVGAWVYKNFDYMSGISVLPYTDHIYVQAPYQEVDEEKWNMVKSKTPVEIIWSELSNYEKTDHTNPNTTFTCTGGACELVDL
jgi:ribonucleoside-diphosphate reductase alpha chain